MIFQDRSDAGRRLAIALASYREPEPMVFGIGTGGVMVAAEVAQALHAPLDVLLTRHIPLPGFPEFAIGAIAPEALVLDHQVMRVLGVDRSYVDHAAATEKAKLEATGRLFRRARPASSMSRRPVLLIDDGSATASAAEAAVRSARRQGASLIVYAAPVWPPHHAATLRDDVDELVCLYYPNEPAPAARWYRAFPPVAETEVVEVLERFNNRAFSPTR